MKRAGVKSSFFILLYTQNPFKIDTNTKALLKIGTKKLTLPRQLFSAQRNHDNFN